MIIGIDLDNTLVCYDDVFHRVAIEWNLPIPPEVRSKEEIRDYLNVRDRMDDFTRLQGYVYGPGLKFASAMPGAADFVARAVQLGHEVVVVSHKSERPIVGAPYPLREYALHFLVESLILVDDPIVGQTVFFEDSLSAKIERIRALQVDVFVDDLPEVLQGLGYSGGPRRILLDRQGQRPIIDGLESAASWSEVAARILADESST